MSIMGQPLIVWTLRTLEASGIDEVIVVQAPNKCVEETLTEYQFELNISYRVQKQATGMGDALLLCKDSIEGDFLLLHAHQFTADRWIPNMLELKTATLARAVLSGQQTSEPGKYGIFDLNENRAIGMIEKPDPESAPSDIRALGIYLLNQEFIEHLSQETESHYAFESALDRYMKNNDVRVLIQDEETLSLKYPWDLFAANRILMDRHLEPQIASSASVSPLAHIEGDVFIGENAKIYEYAVVKGPCYVGENCVIGTHAIVRDYVNLEPGSVIGAHAEAARSIFQRNSSTHSGFFGDSIFDEGSKIGAGTITANVKVHRAEIRANVKEQRVSSNRKSLGVIVGANTQLGISVNTMPGVMIGTKCFVGPNIIVDKNVPSRTRLILKQELVSKTKQKKES